jgi:SAM-dependent methyltransferase
MDDPLTRRLDAHYGRSNFGETILAWLRQQGKDLEGLTVDDLSPVDQLHGGRLPATRALAELGGVSAPIRVADLGGGLGGPARFLAGTYGCTVDVVDLTAELCAVGEMLTKLVHLGDKVHFYCASATNSRLVEGAYDLVWMQNAAMNIEDRHALYAEIRRLLRRKGRFIFQEVLAGDGGSAYYPTNWASSAEESFLETPESVLRMLIEARFRALFWEDETEATLNARQQERAASIAGTAPPSYLPPERLREAALNSNRSTEESRLRYGRGLFEKL